MSNVYNIIFLCDVFSYYYGEKCEHLSKNMKYSSDLYPPPPPPSLCYPPFHNK